VDPGGEGYFASGGGGFKYFLNAAYNLCQVTRKQTLIVYNKCEKSGRFLH
jgi:hypothetical protein